jgi:hypothetical protein
MPSRSRWSTTACPPTWTACPPTCDIHGGDPQRRLYVDTRRLLRARSGQSRRHSEWATRAVHLSPSAGASRLSRGASVTAPSEMPGGIQSGAAESADSCGKEQRLSCCNPRVAPHRSLSSSSILFLANSPSRSVAAAVRASTTANRATLESQREGAATRQASTCFAWRDRGEIH